MVKKIHLKSLEEINKNLVNRYSSLSNFIFRGESNESYSLLPTSLRPNNMIKVHNAIFSECKKEFTQVKAEFRLLQEFYVYAKNNGLDIPKYERFDRSENPLDNRFW